MLDSYADRVEDAATGDHSYISHYPNTEVAIKRLAEIIDQTMHAACARRGGFRHAVIAASMIAMYLSRTTHAPRPHCLPHDGWSMQGDRSPGCCYRYCASGAPHTLYAWPSCRSDEPGPVAYQEHDALATHN